jgi:hypothetical protein
LIEYLTNLINVIIIKYDCDSGALYLFTGDDAGVVCATDVGAEAAAAVLSLSRQRTVQLHRAHEPIVQIDCAPLSRSSSSGSG